MRRIAEIEENEKEIRQALKKNPAIFVAGFLLIYI